MFPRMSWRRSFAEMTSWESFLYSESGAVYRGAKKAEALLGRGALLTGHMKLERPMWDALNPGSSAVA